MNGRVEAYEWAAGRLLWRAYRLRVRGGIEDVHEALHIASAIDAGNTDDCRGPRACKLNGFPPSPVVPRPDEEG